MPHVPIRTTPINRRQLIALGALGAGAMLAAPPIASLAQSRDSSTFVVAGLDSRSPIDPGNTDVQLLVRVDNNAGTVRALSIPRDLYVLIPGFGRDKICRAFDLGQDADGDGDWEAGAETLADTIRRNFGVVIDGSAITDFNGFPKVIDTLGGIEVDNPYDVYNLDRTRVVFPAGRLFLTGEEALEFARTRHQDGDDGRVDRQQLVLAAMLDRAQDPAIRDKLPSILTTARDAIETDVSIRLQVRLLGLAQSLSSEDVAFGTITEFLTEETLASGMWVYQADWDTLPTYVQDWLNGDVQPSMNRGRRLSGCG